MEFKDFFSILKKRISDGADVPYFFRDLIAMITDVSEEEWGTQKDPSTKLTKENTLRNYSKRGLSKKFAESIVYRLDRNLFVESINQRSVTVRELLADDFKAYDATATEANIGELLADCFIEIIRSSAGLVQQSVLEKQAQQKNALELKNKYGDYLVNEANHTCPFPGCGRELMISRAGKIASSYEVSLIDKKKAPEVNNLLALCPNCYATYSIDSSTKVTKQLIGVKKILVGHGQNVALLENLSLEKGIVDVLKKVKKLNQKDLSNASLEPKEITQKISPEDDFALYMTINSYVNAYYVRIREIMTNADKRGEIDYDEVQDQIHAMYKKLKKAKKSKVDIFNEIAQKIHKVSLMDEILCQIVVSYFVQSCEIFDAIT